MAPFTKPAFVSMLRRKALSAGDFHSLMEITKMQADLDSSYQQSADDAGTMSVPQSLETQLLIKHAQTISHFEKEIDDDPVYACCSCEEVCDKGEP